MKPYIVTLEVKTKWTMEVHAEDKHEAEETAEGLDYAQIETGGEFGKVLSIEATDTELVYPEDEEDEVGEPESPEPVPTPEETGFVETEETVEPEEDTNDRTA